MAQRRGQRVRLGVVATLAGAAALLAGCSSPSDADYEQNSLKPAGPAARDSLDLLTPFFWIAIVIGVAVVAATVVTAWRFRVRPGRDDNPRQVHGRTGLEVGWTIVPALILVVMAVPTVATIFKLAEKPKDPLEITVTGKQWWWQYEYEEEGFLTANEMHVPVGKPVFLTLTSTNVQHSFWIPSLAGKMDLVPGQKTTLTIEADEPGLYLGQCAEYCGLSHANMRLRVIADTPEDYAAWVASQKAPLAATAATYVEQDGGPVATYGCAGCHGLAPDEGDGLPGPNLSHLGDRTTFAGASFDLTLENLTRWVWDAPALKPMNPPKVGMPSFRKAGMTQDQAAEIARVLLCETGRDPGVHPDCS